MVDTILFLPSEVFVKKGSFQHSSFLAGGAITTAGRLMVKDGILKVCSHREK
jgi:hypothetical protein